MSSGHAQRPSSARVRRQQIVRHRDRHRQQARVHDARQGSASVRGGPQDSHEVGEHGAAYTSSPDARRYPQVRTRRGAGTSQEGPQVTFSIRAGHMAYGPGPP